jgi:hypothetical protein
VQRIRPGDELVLVNATQHKELFIGYKLVLASVTTEAPQPQQTESNAAQGTLPIAMFACALTLASFAVTQ